VLAAAERYSITDLKGCLTEIDALGPAARRASDSLRRYVRSYDMNGILGALGRSAPGRQPLEAEWTGQTSHGG
jgi:hypothetical protein